MPPASSTATAASCAGADAPTRLASWAGADAPRLTHPFAYFVGTGRLVIVVDPSRRTQLVALPFTTRLHRPLAAFVALIVLAGLDLVGAVLAKHWNDHRSWVSLVGGMLVFAALFGVYGTSLAYGELATVTISWVVILQVGVLLIDRYHNGVRLPAGKWLAVIAILALQGYLLVSSNAVRPA